MANSCKIVFIKCYDFPLGGASQNRTISLCKGLVNCSNKVEIHIFGPGKRNLDLNKIRHQYYQNIEIFNHSAIFVPCTSKFKQFIGLIYGLILTIFSVIFSNMKNKISYIFLGNSDLLYIIIFWLICKLIGAKLVRELNEYPKYLIRNEDNIIKYSVIDKIKYKFFDVFVFITTNLLNYYTPLVKRKHKSIIIPMTVDTDRFDKLLPIELRDPYLITYCGDLSQNKDGTLSLIKAFYLLASQNEKYKLQLIGSNNDLNVIKNVITLINQLKLENRVILSGYMHPDKIPEALMKSSVLVLCRPNNKQAEGGFPTKLGEYLASGVPVVVTSVGEIPLYLKHKETAFLCEPDDIESFYNTLNYVILNYEEAIEVGLRGRELAYNIFSYKIQGKILSDFLIS